MKLVSGAIVQKRVARLWCAIPNGEQADIDAIMSAVKLAIPDHTYIGLYKSTVDGAPIVGVVAQSTGHKITAALAMSKMENSLGAKHRGIKQCRGFFSEKHHTEINFAQSVGSLRRNGKRSRVEDSDVSEFRDKGCEIEYQSTICSDARSPSSEDICSDCEVSVTSTAASDERTVFKLQMGCVYLFSIRTCQVIVDNGLDESTWGRKGLLMKIGSTNSVNPIKRVTEQNKHSGVFETFNILFSYATPHWLHAEAHVHAILKTRNKHYVQPFAGTEWFVTSVDEVKRILEGNTQF